MEKFTTDERTGLKYKLIGDYYYPVFDDESDEPHFGIWAQRHHDYLRKTNNILFSQIFLSGKMYDYLADIDRQAEEMFSQLIKQLAEQDGITETLKASNQMEWVRRMNAARLQATEIVNNELIYLHSVSD